MCGNLSYTTLMGVDYYERESDLDRIVDYIKRNYEIGDYIYLDPIVDHVNIEPLSDEEARIVIENLEK